MLYHLCAATILSDVNCRSEWNVSNNTYAQDDTRHSDDSTLVECKKACEFDPHCVSVDWSLNVENENKCDLNTKIDHTHNQSGSDTHWKHYDLVNRCHISGQCFDHTV